MPLSGQLDPPGDTFLGTIIRRIRYLTDEPAVQAKYDPSVLIADFIEPSWGELWEGMMMSSSNPVVCRMDIKLVKGIKKYRLSPNVRRIVRVGKMDDQGVITAAVFPKHPDDVCFGWLVNGPDLELTPFPLDDNMFTDGHLTIWYIPSGDVRLHQGEGDHSPGGNTSKFRLAAAPVWGRLDRRVNAYAGLILRIFDPSLTTTHEEVITSYDPATRDVTLNRALDAEVLAANGPLEYEVAPFVGDSYSHAISWIAAKKIMTTKGTSGVQYSQFEKETLASLKSIRDSMSRVNSQTGGLLLSPERTPGVGNFAGLVY